MAGLKRIWSFLLLCLLSQCAPSLQDQGMMFVAEYTGSEIYMADFSSDSLDSLTFSPLPLGSVRQPIAVDYDPGTRMVYWTERSGSIRRGNIDGTDQSEIVTGLGNPQGIALDTNRGKVFWTDYIQDQIESANLDGSSRKILIDNIYRPRGIIVHPEEEVMFWTELYTGTIERANLDGGDRYVIVSSSVDQPNGLTFNADGSRIYWCEAEYDKMESADLWGQGRVVHLATSSIYPFDLAVVGDKIVWTDWYHDAIGITSNDDNSSYSFYYHSVFQYPFGMHVYQGWWHFCSCTYAEINRFQKLRVTFLHLFFDLVGYRGAVGVSAGVEDGEYMPSIIFGREDGQYNHPPY